MAKSVVYRTDRLKQHKRLLNKNKTTMANYLPEYDTVGYYSSGEKPIYITYDERKAEQKYAKLLPETQIQEDENSQYQLPDHERVSGNKSVRKSQRRSKACAVILSIVAILLLLLTIAGVVLASTGWRQCNKNCIKNNSYPSTCEPPTLNVILMVSIHY